ncbi:MAG: aminotransferase class I/II-fold pyridoxal phosphate-dependent enzyme [Patulibacter sp.]|nr:aminotransferase class I/II-fold pyridoxal phosphate-dependent enzyme [Patulibacter sp.]
MSDPQSSAPYLDAIAAYGSRGSGRMHVPGHKGGPGADPGLRAAIGERALMMDVPAGIYGVDLGVEVSPQLRAEALAAEAYGAEKSWFLTNGATQGNHALALSLAPPGSTVVVQRNSHASVVDGLVLSGGRPAFVAPAYDETLGIAHTVTPEALAGALALAPEARSAFIVSPTYFGVTADIAGLAEVAHRHDCALVVDQSWGPHFGFHPDVPESALRQGADAVLTSTHKMAGSLTQSAILHVVDGSRVDIAAVDRAVRIVRSTSASSLLLSSLDAARRQLAVHGEPLLDRTMRGLGALHDAIAEADGLRVLGPDLRGAPGVHDVDPLKVVIDVRGTGSTGYAVGQALGSWHDVHPELFTDTTVLLVLGPAERPDDLALVGLALQRTAQRIQREVAAGTAESDAPRIIEPLVAPTSETVIPPRDAFLGPAEAIPLEDAVGRVSAESIAGYPPGIPALLPGERITPAVIEHFRALLDAGAKLHGAHDQTLRTITVVR